MYVIDRYVLRLFVKVLLVCFCSMTGMYFVVDTFTNLDEFLSLGESTEGGLLAVLCEYYGARVLTSFDRTGAVFALIAAIFVVAWLQRTNELTALMAAGIPKRRVVRPVIIAAMLVSLVLVANRELLIPQVREQLTRNAQNWLGDQEKSVEPQWDLTTDVFLSGTSLVPSERRIVQPSFQLFTPPGTFGHKLAAENAYYQEPAEGRPGGYLLDGVTTPDELARHPTAYLDDQPIILSPADTSWLTEKQCFVVSDVGFEHLANDSKWRRFAPSWELIAGLRNPSLDYGTSTRVTLHTRFVQPLLDVSLLFLGLSVVFSRQQRGIFFAGGLCLLIVAGFFITILGFQAMGTFGLLSPHFAAWCPAMIFVPLATLVLRRMRE